MREGGKAYWALDITQPDDVIAVPCRQGSTEFLCNIPQPINGYVPSCWDNPIDDTGACGPLPFPSPLWEFTDRWPNTPLVTDEDGYQSVDEDGNGFEDIGFAWSTPDIGRIKVTVGKDVVEKYVAIFGGGLDPEKQDRYGNWLYIVDIETGEPIYKHQLVGSAPGEPAAVDTDQNGFIDRIYIGTTAGFLYKMDVRSAAELKDETVTDYLNKDEAGREITRTVQRVTDSAWDPFPIFDTGGRPIYFSPAVIYVASLGKFGLAFGTGDREDLWEETAQEGRIYMFLDNDFTALDAAKTEANLQPVLVDGANEARGVDFLSSGGWYIRLDADERVITEAFALSGVVTLSSFQPKQIIDTFEGGPLCGRAGVSRIFAMLATNGNGLFSGGERHVDEADFVSSPFTDLNSGGEGGGDGGDGGDGGGAPPPCDPTLTQALMDTLPADCKYANVTVDIKMIRSDTGMECIAAVPVCFRVRHWKEF
jgi:hypothetical protein